MAAGNLRPFAAARVRLSSGPSRRMLRSLIDLEAITVLGERSTLTQEALYKPGWTSWTSG